MRRGFSLVELSIVLVILGLLTGGILGGRSLIRAAELRSVTTEWQSWNTAINTFKIKYNAFPGDMKTATRFWGDAGVCATVESDSHLNRLEGTCDGDGNGVVFFNGNDRYERFLFWQHLQKAGLVGGDFSGVRGPGSPNDVVAKVNVPASKFNNAVWYSAYSRIHTDTTHLFARDYSNALVLEGDDSAPWGSVMPPDEAWGIDSKLDDGKPASGFIVSNRSDGNCTNGSSITDYAATYQLSESGHVCTLYFLQAR